MKQIETLEQIVNGITPLDKSLGDKIQSRLDNLTKPKGSLGRLEELALKYMLIKTDPNPKIPNKSVFVFAADHGVTEEGVSAFPKEVTFQMVANFLAQGAGINVLARHVGADVKVIDIGVDADLSHLKGLIHKKVLRGTQNMLKGPAMDREDAIRAIWVGAEVAKNAIDAGVDILCTGEMGIGNTTAASAITAVICNKTPKEVTGRGTGIDDEALKRKISVIEKAIKVNSPDPTDPIDVLSKVGGLEIAGICGLILMSSYLKTPVVIDGFISTAGALVAYELNPLVKEYMFAGHVSVEQGHKIQLSHMGLRPILDLDLRLGEGTGAVLATNIIDAGLKIYLEMATFDDAKVSPGENQYGSPK